MDIDDASCSNNSSQLTQDDSTESDSPPESSSKPSSLLTPLSAADAMDCADGRQDAEGSSSSNNQDITQRWRPLTRRTPCLTVPRRQPNQMVPYRYWAEASVRRSLHPAGNEVLKASDLLTGKNRLLTLQGSKTTRMWPEVLPVIPIKKRCDQFSKTNKRVS